MPAPRLLLLGVAALFVAGAAASPTQAYYDGPWCAVFSTGAGSVAERCDLPNFEACRHEAQFFGSTAFCRQNSRYAPYWGVWTEPPRRHMATTKHRRRHTH